MLADDALDIAHNSHGGLPAAEAARERSLEIMTGGWFELYDETVEAGDVFLQVSLPPDQNCRMTRDEYWFGVGRANYYRIVTRRGDDATQIYAHAIDSPGDRFDGVRHLVFEWSMEDGHLAELFERGRAQTNKSPPLYKFSDVDLSAFEAEFDRQFKLALAAVADHDRTLVLQGTGRLAATRTCLPSDPRQDALEH